MKKIVLLLLTFVFVLSSCGGDTTTNTPDETVKLCEHAQTETVTEKALILKDGFTKTVCSECGELLSETVLPASKKLKILAIGNSFSVDATTFLWSILDDLGVEELIVGNAQIGGCSLDKHWTMAQSGEAAYSYTKYTSSGKKTVSCALVDAVKDEEWDIVTLQQVSQSSGMPDTYTHLTDMIDFVINNCPNVYVDINFHMTWAYQQGYERKAFTDNYNADQMTMYNAIVNTVKSVVLEDKTISRVLPSGTTIQNLRTSYLGDTLNRDGTHLSNDVGRYAVGLTWACAITGASPYDAKWIPSEYAQVAEDFEVIKEAVANAVASPFTVTESKIKEKKVLTLEERFVEAGLNINDYELIDWEPKLFYHWNSTSKTTAGKSDSMPNFIASKKFTKDELPIGSVIVVDRGYKYRPEGWQTADKKNSNTRPSNCTAFFTIVDEAWWDNYTLRAFNVSKETGSEPATEEDTTHFRIYIPKN